MREIVQRMISTGSLSAFSASASNGMVASGGVTAARPATGAQPVRAQSAMPQGPRPDGGARPPQPGASGQSLSGQTLPRGSLLDLSV